MKFDWNFLGGDEYRMHKLNQSMDNLQRPYGNGVSQMNYILFIETVTKNS